MHYRDAVYLCRAIFWGLALAGLASPLTAAPAALAWEAGAGFRSAPVSPGSGRPGFTLPTPEETGVRFTNSLTDERAEANQNLLNGGGVAAGDFDGDGWCDLFFCNIGGPSALFHNLGGWRFEEVTASAGVACTNLSAKGAAFADINGDGRLDLLVNSVGGPNACFLNLGGGRFTNVTASSGMSARVGGHSLALADVDGDGDLDLYLVNYGEISILRNGGSVSVRTINGRTVVTGRMANRVRIIDGQMIELGEPDALLLNNGQGVFAPVSWTGGAFLDEAGEPLKSAPWDMGLSAMFRDLNGDGAPDLYVCNDFQTPDRIWMNDGRGRFRAIAPEAMRTTAHFSMGVDVADINRDGLDDLFVGDMLSRFQTLRMTQIIMGNPPASHVAQSIDRHQARRNTLFLNRGDGTYADIAHFAGVAASDWTWSVVFLDVDLDGYEDLLVANGHAYDTQDMDMHDKSPGAISAGVGSRVGTNKRLHDYPPLLTPNFLFRNRGDLTFAETGAAWGFHSTNVSHGLALADLDNDGDQDVIVSCLWRPPLLYRNESPAPRVAVRLRGQPPNTHGIGARLRVLGGATPVQQQEIIAGGRYLSGDEPLRAFAAGHLTNRMTLEVTWRNGRRSVVPGALANRVYEVDEAVASVAPPAAAPPLVEPLFTDVSARLGHTHEEFPHDDFERQPLLPKSLARLGPGVAWCDLDGDAREELVMGAGRGSPVAVFSPDGAGGFKRWTQPELNQPMNGDVTGLARWISASGQPALLLGVSNYEDGEGRGPAVLRLAARAGGGLAWSNFLAALPGQPSASAGPLAVADYDGDGDLDLFVGGRVVPGRYPEPAPSQLFRNEGGALRLDAAGTAIVGKPGLVSGAVFTDLDADGFAELVLACEWGPLKIFRNERGQFSPWNPPVNAPALSPSSLTLHDLTGWWNGVTAADVDGDGALDLLASNWGLNTDWHLGDEGPLRLYHGDFDQNGAVDGIEALTDPETRRIVPRHGLATLGKAMPGLRTSFPTYASFARVDVATILEQQRAKAGEVQAATLASMVFLNRGGRFEAAPLPAEAQWAPAFALAVADADGDGLEDVFLSQNFFDVRPNEARFDTGRGLWLRGTGQGRFAAMSGRDSGVVIYGQQRGAAVGDFDEDGRVDLVVAQNSGATRVFRNAAAKPGLRVRLSGPSANPVGLGAVVRVKFANRSGAARELHGGSGYWSQDSAVLVLASPEAPAAIEVRWPGGKTTTTPVPAGVRALVIDSDGRVK